MYQFKPATDRIREMRQKIRDRIIQKDASLIPLYTAADKKYKNYMPIIKKGLVTLDVVQHMTVEIEDFELIVGSIGKNFCGSTIDPRFSPPSYYLYFVDSGEWTLQPDGKYHTPDGDEIPMCISAEDVAIIREYGEYWNGATLNDIVTTSAPPGYEAYRDLNISNYGEMPMLMMPAGHLVAGYERVINRGYAAIQKVADDWLEAHYGNMMGDDAKKYAFYRGTSLMCQAAGELCLRYAEACERKKSVTTDPARLAELDMMAASLRRISREPASTFYEACQLTMMYQNFLQLFESYPVPALGRFDKYTWPFLKKELEAGTITEDYAQEIVDAFFLKVNCFYQGGRGRLAQTTGIGNTYQHTTIGGVDPKTGEDATNPVTFMTLETVGRLLLHDPTISLRIHKNSSDRLWDCALETSRLVGGLPLFQNDEVIIPGQMRELGWDLEDARDYGIIGCQEIVGCGNAYPAGNGMPAAMQGLHYGVALATALNNGTNPFNNVSCPVKTGYLYEMNSIEEVREAFRKICDYSIKWLISLGNYVEEFLPYFWPEPGLSLSVDGCMEQGIDIVAGGAKHNSFGGTATGLATIADSFTTIKYMCFDKKLCTTRELYDAVMANWEGYEPLRQRILNEVPHFGNADPYADMEMKWVVDMYYDQCSSVFSSRAIHYKAGLYGAADHVAQGYHTWATPDGRRTGEPIADAASPAQGRDRNGPTAVFESSLCYDHTRMMDGIALNLRIHPTVLSNQDGIDKLRDVSRAYFDQGGLEVQYNVVDSETLRAAQADPGSYRDLVVRIAGYSAYFIELSTDMQNDIISRNENRL